MTLIANPVDIVSGGSTRINATLADMYGQLQNNKIVDFNIVNGEGFLNSSSSSTNVNGKAEVNLTAKRTTVIGVGQILIKSICGGYSISTTSVNVINVPPEIKYPSENFTRNTGERIYIRQSEAVTLENKWTSLRMEYKINDNDWYLVNETTKTINLTYDNPGSYVLQYRFVDNGLTQERGIIGTKTIVVINTDKTQQLVNFPNPFKAGADFTTIRYYLEKPSKVMIEIFDAFGDNVWEKECLSNELGGKSGENNIDWWGKNNNEQVISNGVYICRVTIENENKKLTRKIAVVK